MSENRTWDDNTSTPNRIVVSKNLRYLVIVGQIT